MTCTLQNGLTSLYLQFGSSFAGQTMGIWGAQLVVGSAAGALTSSGSGVTVASTSGGSPVTLVPYGLNEAYAYDSFGNILQNGGFNTAYNANNQMFGYAYDAAGNLLSDGVHGAMTWDAESRITNASGATYIYDAEGNRVEKQGAGVTDTIYFGGKPIARWSANQWTDLIYGPDGLLAEVPGTQTAQPTYRLLDHLGTEIGQTDATQQMLNPLDFRPFGQEFTGVTNDPYMFTGLERDQETGLDHAMFRQYGSNMGRWMSADPYDGSMDFGNPQSLNRYAYVGNTPTGFTDPSGLDGVSIGGIDEGYGCLGAIAEGGHNPLSDIGCAYHLITDIVNAFRHPAFKGTTTPRPGAIWDEHSGITPHASLGGLLGLPNGGGCDFGACGSSAVPGCPACTEKNDGTGMPSAGTFAWWLIKVPAQALYKTGERISYYTDPSSCFYTRKLESNVGAGITALGGAATAAIGQFGASAGIAAGVVSTANGVGAALSLYSGYAYVANRTVCKVKNP